MSEQGGGELRAPSYAEQIYATAYSDAMVKAIGSADTAVAAVVTASFSLATAYGALIGLVSPEDDPGAIILGIPFVGFALAVLTALWVGAIGVPVLETNAVNDVKAALTDTLRSKRRGARAGVVFLVVSVSVASLVVVNAYASPAAEQETKRVSVVLTPEGATNLTEVCPGLDSSRTLGGDLTVASLEEDFLVLKPEGETCEGSEIKIARESIAAIQDL